MNIYEDINNAINNNTAAVLCIVINTEGSTPRKAGSKMLVLLTAQLLVVLVAEA